MINSEFRAECIKRALAGDSEAGFEVLQMCRVGLDNGHLSPDLARYLAERISDLIDGVPPDRALCIALERNPGRPRNQFPEWKYELGALAAVLAQRGYSSKQIADALCDARARIFDKSLDQADAYRISSEYAPMRQMDSEDLLQSVGRYWEILPEYPPVK